MRLEQNVLVHDAESTQDLSDFAPADKFPPASAVWKSSRQPTVTNFPHAEKKVKIAKSTTHAADQALLKPPTSRS